MLSNEIPSTHEIPSFCLFAEVFNESKYNFTFAEKDALLWIRRWFPCCWEITGIDYILASAFQRRRAKTVTTEWSLGSQGDQQNAVAEEKRGRNQWCLFPVNCILHSAEDSREGICKGLDWNLSFHFSFLLPLSPLLLLISSPSGLLILFLLFLDALPLQSHDCWKRVKTKKLLVHLQNCFLRAKKQTEYNLC